MDGAAGVTGCGSIIILDAAGEIHPDELVTVNEVLPEVSPVIILVNPVPAIAPGLMVQFPRGKSLNSTLPVAIAQVGCVIIPVVGAVGVRGCELTIMLADVEEVHPAALVTV